MPYIQLDETQFPLHVGEMSVGTAPEAAIRLPGAGELRVQAILRVSPGDQVAIRRAAPGAVVRVNGVQLGAEPTPLIHGDKIEVAGHELLYGDERKAGGTQMISGIRVPELGQQRVHTPARATTTTGGRLVSLVDGREYAVPATGLTIGRDAGCDVVVPSNDVSRRHAEIAPGERGYIISDLSTNGVFVNGERVQRSQLLGRGDVVSVGVEEFRFYADIPEVVEAAAPATPTPGIEPPIVSAMQQAVAPAPPAAPPPAAASHARDQRLVLATLTVLNEGVQKGRTFEIRTPLAHVGRGAHNDIAIPDESVSDTHAKLQRREEGWVLVDMDSTNGTYVGGRRIQGEQRLTGSPDLRFGGIKMSFRPAAEPAESPKHTRAIAGLTADQARKLSAEVQARAAVRSEQAEEAETAAPRALPGWLWLLVALVLGAGAFYILQGF